tara:strand:- start:14 stop:262 length:249 start_codon:yes stop_codon:yes gene_type:complete
MHWQYTPYILPLFAAALVGIALAAYAWKYRSTRGAPAFALLMASDQRATLASALETASANLPTKLFWAMQRIWASSSYRPPG